MSAFLPEWLKNVVMAAVLLMFALVWAARRFPQLEWLRTFKLPELPAAQRARQKRSSDIHAGVEFILLGVAMVPGYFVLSLMTWSDPSTPMLIAVSALSVFFIALGIWVIRRALRGRDEQGDDLQRRVWP
jgi:hypothetical protein